MITLRAPDLDVDIALVRRAERVEPIDDRKLRAALRAGQWTKVVTGVFVEARAWRGLTSIERHRVRTIEAMRRLRTDVVISHHSAAAIWGIGVLGDWPDRLDISRPPAGGGRSTGAIRRHTAVLETLQVMTAGRHLVTSPAQTALDLARTLPFAEGVAVVDQAIWSARAGGPLTTVEQIVALLCGGPAHRGDTRAMRALSFANESAANVRESQSRVLLAHLGFPKPRIQERRLLRSGRLVFGDFYWPEQDHWGELDGRGKYRSPDFGNDRGPADIVIDEKNRENEIRRDVRGFSRWEPADAVPRRLYDILTGDGLESRLPRP